MIDSIFLSLVLSGLGFPIFLIIGGRFNIPPGSRFKIAAMSIICIWCLICYLVPGENIDREQVLICGMLCISSTFIFYFMLWSVFCWGYTLSMLLCLKNSNGVNLAEWEKKYAGSLGLRTLSINRTSILIWFRLGTIKNDIVILTRAGSICASLFRILSRLCGVL